MSTESENFSEIGGSETEECIITSEGMDALEQVNYFVSVLTLIKSFARRTHIHACTPTYIYKKYISQHSCIHA